MQFIIFKAGLSFFLNIFPEFTKLWLCSSCEEFFGCYFYPNCFLLFKFLILEFKKYLQIFVGVFKLPIKMCCNFLLFVCFIFYFFRINFDSHFLFSSLVIALYEVCLILLYSWIVNGWDFWFECYLFQFIKI